MSKIDHRRIVIASVLKPVDDVRMMQKIGRSLGKIPGCEVHCMGRASHVTRDHELILHPLRNIQRFSFRRLLAPWVIFKKSLAIRPTLFIATTHELLLIGLLLKALTGCRFAYDVQENYFRNILYTNAFPRLFRPFPAVYVRLKEILVSPFVDRFFLAEACYKKELKFVSSRMTVLENKTLGEFSVREQRTAKRKFIFTGTLAPSTGVFEAVALVRELRRHSSDVHLTIIGHATQEETRAKIETIVTENSFITFIGGTTPVAHERIVEEISKADVGIIAYPRNKANENRIPTKLYEYLAYQLPILLIDHRVWTSLCEPYPAAVTFDAGIIDGEAILRKIDSTQFYRFKPEDVFWKSEEQKLLTVVEGLFN